MFSISNCGGRGSTVFPLFKNLYMSVTYLLSLHKPHICLSNILGVWTCLHLSQECVNVSFYSRSVHMAPFYLRSLYMSPFIAGLCTCLLLSQECSHVSFYRRSVNMSPFIAGVCTCLLLSQECAYYSFFAEVCTCLLFVSEVCTCVLFISGVCTCIHVFIIFKEFVRVSIIF